MEKLDLVLAVAGLCLIGGAVIYAVFAGKKSKKEPGSPTIGSSIIAEDPDSKNTHDSSSLK